MSTGQCTTEKVWDRSEGKSTSCTSLGGGESGYTLESCKMATQQANGNAFNLRDGKCYFKRCEDIMDLKAGTNQGGWDVYVLKCTG